MDDRFNWARLKSLQLGKYAEYLVKMEFVLLGCDVFSSEVDGHGIDLVIRTRGSKRRFDIQVKSYRPPNSYVFAPKAKFEISPQSLLAVVQFVEEKAPVLFLIPSCVHGQPNTIFESRDYEGKNSKPEWGLTLSKKKMAELMGDFSFSKQVLRLETAQ